MNLPAMQETTFNEGDIGLIPGLGRSLREGNGKPLQYSCLGNPMDRGVWRATVHGATKESNTSERVNNDNNWFHLPVAGLCAEACT